MKAILLAILFPFLAFAQPTHEVREFTGIVKAIEPGWGFAYEVIVLDIDGRFEDFLFPPEYGKAILEKVKVNEQIKLKANVNVQLRKKIYDSPEKKERAVIRRFFGERITEIFVDGAWLSLQAAVYPRQPFSPKIFLEKKVVDIYKMSTAQYENGGMRERVRNRAFIFENGLIGNIPYGSQRTDDIKKGDIVSFMGYKFPVREGTIYPVEGVKGVYYSGLLSKNSGRLKSLLFKQNTVCIGIVMTTSDGSEFALSIPSDHAQRVRDFLRNKESVTFFYNDMKIKGIIDPPEGHAFVVGSDSLMIEQMGFYGGADVKHDHIPAEVSGAITQVNRSARGMIMSVIVAKNIYVEVDQNTEQQLGPLLKKGKVIAVTGDERVRKQGEIYQKEYHIITPRKITIEGREFLLN